MPAGFGDFVDKEEVVQARRVVMRAMSKSDSITKRLAYLVSSGKLNTGTRAPKNGDAEVLPSCSNNYVTIGNDMVVGLLLHLQSPTA